MIPIREAFPDLKGSWGFFCPPGYRELVESAGVAVLLEVTDNDYQGDSRYLIEGPQGYGVLFFGWGSCSGCDALQDCSSYEDLDSLRESLVRTITWRETPAGLLEYFETHDWEGDWHWHRDETREFVAKGKELLAGLAS